jgi:NitT/TauT family transport system substrate-binding protein
MVVTPPNPWISARGRLTAGLEFASIQAKDAQAHDNQRRGGRPASGEFAMTTLKTALLAAFALLSTGSAAFALDDVTFGTNWKAQAEHGGFYQAVATGIYENHGLNVTIRPGGPQVNHRQLLLAGRIDFNMAGNMFAAFNNAENDIPTVMVASMFQKEPQILMAHPDVGHDSLEDLKGTPILISNDARLTFWEWLKATYGYTDEQILPYTFNAAPFLADEQAVQQGYVTSEPFAVQQQGGFKPVVFLLADFGYDSYSTMIETTRSTVEENPDLVQRFVDASIEGWYSYLYGDPAPANDLIKADNPEMSDEQIAFSIEAMKSYGIVDSGDSETLGIGAMTEDRWNSFLQFAKDAQIYPEDLDISATYTLEFVNKKVGMDLKPQ